MRFLRYGLFILLFVAVSTLADAAWEKPVLFPAAETPLDLTECQSQKGFFYAATSHQVFLFAEKKWSAVFSLPATNESIQRIKTFASLNSLWIQTEKSIYRLASGETRAVLIYSSADPERFPKAFFVGSKTIWVGTEQGLFSSGDHGKTWNQELALADHAKVTLIVETEMGLFYSVNGEWRLLDENGSQTVVKIFDQSGDVDDKNSMPDDSSAETSQTAQDIFFDFIETEERFYVSTLKGVYASQNGMDWQPLSNSGLRNTSIKRIFWDKKTKSLAGLTENGFFIFSFSENHWMAQNDGLAKLDMRSALLLPDNRFAVNSEGLWSWNAKNSSLDFSSDKKHLFEKLLRLEPSARAIHEHVIQYANVSNKKIKRWHAESRVASLLPSLSFGKDLYRANNIDIDRGGTSDRDQFIEGPADKHRSANIDLSWDLGNFIFNSSQTSIDSREKLMVDQRNDLLSEATRIYFERRRLQREIVFAPASDESEHAEKMMRLEELTALLDALTDGYLSKQLERIYQTNTELNALWSFKGDGAQEGEVTNAFKN